MSTAGDPRPRPARIQVRFEGILVSAHVPATFAGFDLLDADTRADRGAP